MSGVAVGSDEWSRRVTASKAAAILGLSPWESPYSVWHQMKGLDDRPQNDAMRRGTYLEPAILAWWRDQHPTLENYTEQVWYGYEDWAGATPDVVAHEDGDHIIADAKSAARMDDWGTPGTDEIPAYYLASTYFQLAVSGAKRCHIAVLGPYLEFSEYVVEANANTQREILTACRAFYDTLAEDMPPTLDGHVATLDTMRRRYVDIDKGVEVETSWAHAWAAAKAELEDATAAERLARIQLLDDMATAQYATHSGTRYARRQASGKGAALYRVKASA